MLTASTLHPSARGKEETRARTSSLLAPRTIEQPQACSIGRRASSWRPFCTGKHLHVPGGGGKHSPPLVEEPLTNARATCLVVCLYNGSRPEPPTGRASLRLRHGARRRPTQGACSSLPLALGCGECLAPGSTHLAFATEAAMNLGLIK